MYQKAPLVCKETTVKESGGVWYNSEIRETKKVTRMAEKLYLKHGIDYHKTQFSIAKQAICNWVTAAKFISY